MKLKYLFTFSFLLLSWNLLAQGLPDCGEKKVSLTTIMSIASASADGKKALTKQVTSPLLEDWSEASGEILSLSLMTPPNLEASFVEASYLDKNKKALNKMEFSVVNKKLENFVWAKIVGAKETRQGEMQLKVLDKTKKAICQKMINIHYADQLDR